MTAAVSMSPASPIALIDQRRPHGADRDQLLAEHKPGDVEIVDHHVAEEAARPGDIGKGRGPGIARGDRNDFERADRPLGDALAQRGEIGVEAAVEADHQRRAGLSDHFEAGADAIDVEVDRLLAEDRLAGAGGALDEIGVGVGRRADGDRVDVLRCEDRVDVSDLGARGFGQSGGGGRVGVGDEGHAAAGTRGRVAAMDLADPARPDDPELHTLLPFGALRAARPVHKKEYTFHIDLGIEFLFH